MDCVDPGGTALKLGVLAPPAATQVPSPRQNVLELADVPELRVATGRFPVTPPAPEAARLAAEAVIVPAPESVAPEGMLMVSPEAPRVIVVPVLGSIAFTFIKLILLPKLIPKELSPFP